jgi:hypothetical protein
MASGSWNTVSDETQVKFTADGDVFTGQLNSLGMQGTIPQAHFTGTGEFKGGDYFTNCGHDLMRRLEKVPLGSEVRITRTGTLDTGQATPMMVFTVDYR